jgi:hypothetical protein
MMRVDLTAIHNLMAKFYGSSEMGVYTFAERKHFIKPKEIKLIFDYKEDCNLEIERLTRRLSRYIWDCHNFFVSIKDHKIEVTIVFYIKRKQSDYDFEFSEN